MGLYHKPTKTRIDLNSLIYKRLRERFRGGVVIVTAKRGQNGKGVGNFLGHLLTLMSWYTPNRGKLKLKLTPTSGVCLY